ncbi:MAG: aminotransferase class I/II-fold pyridoxal phosphate-dependent enzyme [Anaerolineae bacterium]|nr:aminotransferase class I/II-fold pyridoxal phosphate-dependent enzyme [Anaerolineae bacterium]
MLPHVSVSPSLATRVRGFGPSVFAEYTALADRHGAVNLGQGFPDFPAPDFIKAAAQSAIAADHNQYTRYGGHLALVEALAAQAEVDLGRPVDPLHEVQIMAGGVPVFVPLYPQADGRWRYDPDELRRAFGPRTKLLLLNTPHNPTGKVYDETELAEIAALCQEHDVIVVSDEVYERMLFVHDRLPRIATLPGMWERTLSIGSAGKTFSVTGWKIGWAIGPAPLVAALRAVQQWLTFSVATPFQVAVAEAVRAAPALGYYEEMAQMYRDKRDRLAAILTEARLRPFLPEATYFIMADTSAFGFPDDDSFCRWLTTEIGVAAIPPGSFYSPPHKHLARHLARFCFCKKDETLQAVAERLRALA